MAHMGSEGPFSQETEAVTAEQLLDLELTFPKGPGSKLLKRGYIGDHIGDL